MKVSIHQISSLSSILLVLVVSILLEENGVSSLYATAFQMPSYPRSTITSTTTTSSNNNNNYQYGSLLLLSSQRKMSGNNDDNSNDGGGDKLRASTGIRPSLHPTTINAISQALMLRSSSNSNNDMPMEVGGEVEPLEVAIAAGKLAAIALKNRATSCQADGDEESSPREDECQTVAGRVVGVVMRFRELEQQLIHAVKDVPWVLKYHEESSFGLLRNELLLQQQATTTDDNDNDDNSQQPKNDLEEELSQRIRDDPLFRMCRAECLFALFLQNVELPSLTKSGHSVPGGSFVDFIDQDRLEVLFPDLN